VFHVKHEGWAAAARSVGVDLPPEALDRLFTYEGLLRERATAEGLVAPADAPRIRERHLLDCLRAAPLVPPGPRRAYDLGSGAGLPGVVLAVALPALQVHLVESRRHRSDFLRDVVAALDLPNANVEQRRAEDLDGRADVCFARAFAPPERAWATAAALLVPGGRLLYWAGRSYRRPSGVSTEEVAGPPGSGPVVVMRLAAP